LSIVHQNVHYNVDETEYVLGMNKQFVSNQQICGNWKIDNQLYVLFDLKKNTQDESKMHLQMKLMLDAATFFQKLL